MFRCTPQMLGLSQANAESARYFHRVTLPNWKRAVKTAAILPNKCLVAEFLEMFEVHGNSLGLTSKSPLTFIRMAGAVVQRIGGAWAYAQCGRVSQVPSNFILWHLLKFRKSLTINLSETMIPTWLTYAGWRDCSVFLIMDWH